MSSPRNKRTVTLGVAVVSLAAAGGAIAATKIGASHKGSGGNAAAGSPISATSAPTASTARGWHALGHLGGPMDGRHGDLSDAAAYLGISETDLIAKLQSGKTLAQIANATSGKSASGLIDALVAAEKKEIASAVASGRLTQAQADRISSDLKQRITDHVNATGPPRGHGGHGGPREAFAAAATYLGISEDALIADLRAGKTLGQIADATSGKSKAGLIAALVAQEKAELAQAVTDGRLTQAQANDLATEIQDRITRLVDGTLPPHPDGPPPAGSSGSSTAPPAHI
jgi:hypothetical protein